MSYCVSLSVLYGMNRSLIPRAIIIIILFYSVALVLNTGSFRSVDSTGIDPMGPERGGGLSALTWVTQCS
jgi:hypothetical protein